MNIFKTSSSLRLIAFFLVAVLLICLFGFSADGWHINAIKNHFIPNRDSPQINQNNRLPNTESEAGNIIEEELQEIFTCPISGLQCSEDAAGAKHYSLVFEATPQIYGISSADMLIEFPTESAETRLLCFFPCDTKLTKLGSLAKTRPYISNLSHAFDSILFSSGTEIKSNYSATDVSDRKIDLEEGSPFCYSEFNKYLYTNSDMLKNALKSLDTGTARHSNDDFFQFIDSSEEEVFGDSRFERINIPYSQNSSTALTYDAETKSYIFTKSSGLTKDMLDGKSILFKNCFILFADSATYDTYNGSELVLNTIGEGVGYYFTNGTAIEIKWQNTIDGDLTLSDTEGNELSVNRGKTYMSFVKSSMINDIVFH